MRRRAFVSLLALSALGAAGRARAQPRVARIGYLVQSPLIDPPSAERAAFLDELHRLGYTVGENLRIEYRSAQNVLEFLPDMARELVSMKVDLIVAAGASSAKAARAATGSIPIVFTLHPDPVGSGLVRSLAKPGGNVTGVSFVSPDLAGKRLQLLHEMLPSAKRVALVFAPYTARLSAEMEASEQAARRLGIRLEQTPVESAEALVRSVEQAARGGLDALLVVADLKMVAYRDILIEEARRYRVPIVAGWSDIVRAGALLSYAPNFAELFRRSARYVDKILRGARPADLPVEQPTDFELVVNLRTARALGIVVPPAVLLRADTVIR